VSQIDAASNVHAAILMLQDIVEGKIATPDVIVLDLNFSTESGFEVLRHWRFTPKLKCIPVVIWTQLGRTGQELCDYFGVQSFIPKWAGLPQLEQALSRILPYSSNPGGTGSQVA
jgi:CheY-like chemotaxis protein